MHPSLTYRIVGRMHSCEDFILAIRRNFMHMENNGTIAELNAHDLGLRPGDDFEILLGGEGNEPNRVPLPDEALSVSIREYYFDWQPREPATFTIECLDADGPSAPFTSEHLAFGLDEAATHLHRSLTYWNQYMIDARAAQTDNVFGGGYDVKRGLAAAKYAFCFFDLAPDEALVVDTDIPQSRYWSFHLYSLAWWEALEFRDARHDAQPHADAHQRRRPHPRRRRARGSRRRQLARHRGSARGTAHAAVVLARGRPAVTGRPGREAGRRARRAPRRRARRHPRATPRRAPRPPRPRRLALPHLTHSPHEHLRVRCRM